jgi:hypothetical protein
MNLRFFSFNNFHKEYKKNYFYHYKFSNHWYKGTKINVDFSRIASKGN